MAATKRKSSVKSESKSPAPKRSRTSTSPVKKEEETDDEGEQEVLRKPRDHQDEIHILPDEMKETPLAKLYEAMKELSEVKTKEAKPSKDGIVVYWMRLAQFYLSFSQLEELD